MKDFGQGPKSFIWQKLDNVLKYIKLLPQIGKEEIYIFRLVLGVNTNLAHFSKEIIKYRIMR